MSNTLIILDSKADWAAYYPSDNVLTFREYLDQDPPATVPATSARAERVRIINLCQDTSYLSEGYYCSLLAEARGHSVIPSVRTLNDLNQRALYRLELGALPGLLSKLPAPDAADNTLQFLSFFGTSNLPEYSGLAQKLFEFFPCPVLAIRLRHGERWAIESLQVMSHRSLDDADETRFAEALDQFSRKIWRKRKSRKQYRFDLAILTDPEEKLPPSNKGALNRFLAAGKALDIDCELVTRKDYLRLPEYDALFIRTTTAINHFTYRFAKRAELEGLVVIDDPTSILRCTNKIYLADLFARNRVPAPRTELLHRTKPDQIALLEARFDYPMVLKIPDGSFSVGVEKVRDRQALQSSLKRLFEQSTLLLAQEYLYTEFDWRIGVLNNEAIYACRYYMVRNHWQIYRHGKNRTDSGGFETLPVSDAPRAVVDSALKATRLIGDGFYGVDIKEKDGKGYVIEINDNPSIESGVEDRYLGDDLYRIIMMEMLRRMEARRGTAREPGRQATGNPQNGIQ